MRIEDFIIGVTDNDFVSGLAEECDVRFVAEIRALRPGNGIN